MHTNLNDTTTNILSINMYDIMFFVSICLYLCIV
jgi:hypothetical protein